MAEVQEDEMESVPMFKKSLIRAAAAVLVSVAAMGGSNAAVVTLTFEGVGNLNPVGTFYSGISFSGNAYGLVDCDALGANACDPATGTGGNFANEPSSDTALFSSDSEAIVMTIAAGFETGFSLFYSSNTTGRISILDGIDGGGAELASFALVAQYNTNCAGDPNGEFCNWTEAGVGFAGLAKSVRLVLDEQTAVVRQAVFDNLTLGAAPGDTNGVPEPTSLALAGAALLGLVAARRRRR